MGEIMAGEATPVQVAGFLIGLQARARPSVVRASRHDARHAVRIEVPGPSLDIVGTGRPRSHGEHLDDVGDRGGRLQGPHRQARQPGRLVGVGLPMSSRPWVSTSRCRRGGSPSWPPRPGSPSVSPRPSTPRCVTQRWPRGSGWGPSSTSSVAHQPGQPTYAAVGVVDRRMAAILAGVFAERGRDAAVFRGDDGLDADDGHHLVGVVGRGSQTREHASTRSASASTCTPRRRCAAGTRP